MTHFFDPFWIWIRPNSMSIQSHLLIICNPMVDINSKLFFFLISLHPPNPWLHSPFSSIPKPTSRTFTPFPIQNPLAAKLPKTLLRPIFFSATNNDPNDPISFFNLSKTMPNSPLLEPPSPLFFSPAPIVYRLSLIFPLFLPFWWQHQSSDPYPHPLRFLTEQPSPVTENPFLTPYKQSQITSPSQPPKSIGKWPLSTGKPP